MSASNWTCGSIQPRYTYALEHYLCPSAMIWVRIIVEGSCDRRDANFVWNFLPWSTTSTRALSHTSPQSICSSRKSNVAIIEQFFTSQKPSRKRSIVMSQEKSLFWRIVTCGCGWVDLVILRCYKAHQTRNTFCKPGRNWWPFRPSNDSMPSGRWQPLKTMEHPPLWTWTHSLAERLFPSNATTLLPPGC